MSEKSHIVGFIGLGKMGKSMVMRLLRAGYSPIVFDLNLAKMENLISLGARAAVSNQELANKAEIIISMLQGPVENEALLIGENGILGSMKDKTYIDMSTTSVASTIKLSLLVEQAGGVMLDAPVSGGMSGAKDGTLSMMVGGREDVFLRLKELLSVFSNKIYYVGPSGRGIKFKLLNNLIYSINMCALAEGIVLGEKLGFSLSELVNILGSGSASSYCIHHKANQYILPNNFSKGFSIMGLLKDLNFALDMAKEENFAFRLGELAREYYVMAESAGLRDKDNSAVIQLFRNK